MLALLDGAGEPFSRSSYGPGHFTASAFITSPARDAVLLILHGKLGLWLQPGGHVEPGDNDILAAARREVLEEVGLNNLPLAHAGVFDLDVHVIPAHGNFPAHEHFDVRFLLVAASDSGHAGSDARDARWVPLSELPRMHTDESVMRAVRKLAGTD